MTHFTKNFDTIKRYLDPLGEGVIGIVRLSGTEIAAIKDSWRKKIWARRKSHLNYVISWMQEW